MAEDDLEVMDVEDYRSGKDQEFSHQALVMMATRKIIEYGCQELVPGYYNTEEDNKGKTKIVYKQDTRKAFIESVRTLRMIMICDFDEDAKKKLSPISEKDKKEKPKEAEENLLNKIQQRKDYWMEEQKKWWDQFTDGQKREMARQGQQVMEGYFNMNLPFFQQYFLEELEIYREVFEELTQLTSRKKFYTSEKFEG